MEALARFGSELEEEIERREIRLTAQQAVLVRSLLDERYERWFLQEVTRWMHMDDEDERLERFHHLVAQFQYGRLYPAKLRSLLDALADEYDARYTERDPLLLAEFLFQGYALRGVDENDYYNPLNSNLVYVIEQRRGIPISLACIYILVGKRLTLHIEGCNLPGHFLAATRQNRKRVYVDCYHGGALIDPHALRAAFATLTRKDISELRCDAFEIAARVVRNLIYAYEQHAQDRRAELMRTVHALITSQ
jgi:regulator of sirC expression with transglutaminase-like and TPR domain